MQSVDPDIRFMQMAMDQAEIAEENGDVPIGAVIVYENRVIAKAYNQREQLSDPTAHAEIISLTQAAAYIGNWRLHGCSIYVTLEPCTMCAGALVLGRLDRLVYGCDDPKTGAVKSLYNIVQDQRLNHTLEVTSGIMARECSEQIQRFFLDENGGFLMTSTYRPRLRPLQGVHLQFGSVRDEAVRRIRQYLHGGEAA